MLAPRPACMEDSLPDATLPASNTATTTLVNGAGHIPRNVLIKVARP